MKNNRPISIAVIAGILLGLLGTYPRELGPTPCIAIWAVGGIVVGLFAANRILLAGGLYGFLLSAVFLYSRFGGTADKLAKYSIFVAAMSIVGALGGILTVFLGSKLKLLARKER